MPAAAAAAAASIRASSSLVVVTRDDPHDRHLFARARVGIGDVGAGRATEPRRLGLAHEDARALRPICLLDPDLLAFTEGVHRTIVPDWPLEPRVLGEEGREALGELLGRLGGPEVAAALEGADV